MLTPMPAWKKNGCQEISTSIWAVNHARRLPDWNVISRPPPAMTQEVVSAK